MNKNVLLQLLADNQIENLFGQLKTYNNRELILLQSQWHDLRQREQLGTVSAEQADIEDARIRQSLLDLIEQVFAPFVQSVGAETNALPSASRPTSTRRLIIVAAATAFLLIILMTTSRLFQLDNENPQATVKTLAIPKTAISIVSTQAGPITWQLLKIERAEFNAENWQLSISASCIKPLYGQNVHAGTLHLRHDADEIAPFAVQFPFVEPGTTGTGNFRFQVPKMWKKATLVIYHQEYDHPQTATVELNLEK